MAIVAGKSCGVGASNGSGESKKSGPRSRNGIGSAPIAAWLALGILAALFGAGPAIALDAIEISPGLAAAEADACPALTRVKYPWSDCGKGFALGFTEGEYGQPPASQCRLYTRDGICAATTEPWGANYLGVVPALEP